MTKNRRYRYSYEQVFRDWYGQEMGSLEIESYQKRGKKLEKVLDNVLGDLDHGDQILFRKIIDEWPNLVSPEISHVSSPRKIYNNILCIEVYDAPWRYSLERNFKSEIQKLIQNLSNQRIKTIRFVPGGKTRTFNRQ